MTFLSRTETVSDGTTSTFSISFPFLDRTHVGVFVTAVDASTPASYTGTVTFNSDSQVVLNPVPATGVLVSIRRSTPVDDLIDILTAPSTFNAPENNLIFTQLLYLIQEALDAGLDLEDEGILGILADIRFTYSVPVAATQLFDLNETVGPIPIEVNTRLLAGLPGSVSNVATAPATTHVLTILKFSTSGATTSIGTITITPAGAVTVDFQNPIDFAPGEAIGWRTTTAGGLTNFGFNFRFQRT